MPVRVFMLASNLLLASLKSTGWTLTTVVLRRASSCNMIKNIFSELIRKLSIKRDIANYCAISKSDSAYKSTYLWELQLGLHSVIEWKSIEYDLEINGYWVFYDYFQFYDIDIQMSIMIIISAWSHLLLDKKSYLRCKFPS